ncbi:MAG TPA: ABC transporter substrate-binding protein [Lachnoclostridium phytofermentans]|uniref:ABC transporter substrate-binding protein n=1 Tax=Lachnoclostridium phytofermentans TaxID=66219 RepID=A0A3D2X1X6_9FIRM|nr:extracellular solute-binding protein [Lachnoclostridium sp.]HCL01141.1 ABC transporter substrate-binding protein [Lachnoclostridium phytofermentans]
MKKMVTLLLILTMVVSSLAACGKKNGSTETGTKDPVNEATSGAKEPEKQEPTKEPEKQEPVKIKIFYSDNATLPFKEDWLVVKEAEKRFNVDFDFEVIPIADYQTKVSLTLNTGNNAPDVILYQSTQGENASLALNGALVPISDYSDYTPNFNARVEEFGLTGAMNLLNLADGKRYYMPGLFDVPFYDGGLILREDFLEAEGLAVPKTFDDLYNILKAYKAKNPDSYPLTILAGPRVLYRMTMPSFGVSLGKNGAGGSNTLSWDYEKGEYFEGAISDGYKQYISYLAKLYAEGLLDPEMADPIDGDKWSQKMASGKAMATYAYYDQIGGVTASSEIAGFKLQMYPSLEGPAGAHHQQKNRTGSGIMFPAATAQRKDFERVVRTIDEVFFSEEGAKLWCLGVEGVTYTEENGKIKYSDELVNSAEGVYKTLQVKYGCGSDVTQLVWVNEREMTKYDENYARINKEVAAMGDVIQQVPPTPLFDDMKAEDAGVLQTPLFDTFSVWTDAFITGKKSVANDWDAYVNEMKTLKIDEFCKIYNDNLN